MAEAYFDFLRQTYDDVKISRLDSAGTAHWHIGSDPDPRTMSTLRSNGIVSYEHSARQIAVSDFFDFDYILAMDRSNLAALLKMRNKAIKRNEQLGRTLAKVRLFGEGTGGDEEVSDPYYSGARGFEECFAQVEKFAVGFATEVFKLPDDWQAKGKKKSSPPLA